MDADKQAEAKELPEKLVTLFALERGSSTQSEHPILQARSCRYNLCRWW